MKSSLIPSVRVEPAFRAELESLLAADETLSEFVESSVRAAVARRRDQAAFVERGLGSLASARISGDYADPDVVLKRLEAKVAAARARALNRTT